MPDFYVNYVLYVTLQVHEMNLFADKSEQYYIFQVPGIYICEWFRN